MRSPRLFGIKNFADRANAVLVHVRDEPLQKRVCAGAILGVNFEPSIYEGADQPGPNRALMISRVARANVAEISGFVIRMGCIKRAQAERSEQTLLYGS